VCDPCEASDFAYSVNGILVSDFYTPHYFDPVTASGVRYSYTGAITRPRQVLRGGYLSWKDSVSGHWWQETWFDGGQPGFRDIGAADTKAGSIRSFHRPHHRRANGKSNRPGKSQCNTRRSYRVAGAALVGSERGDVASANQADHGKTVKPRGAEARAGARFSSQEALTAIRSQRAIAFF
jgi:hypothetical protein